MNESHHWQPFTVDALIALIRRRWVLRILYELQAGALRRTTLRSRLGGISDKVLTETLRAMEGEDLVTRTIIMAVPIEVDYALGGRATELVPLLDEIHAWALANNRRPTPVREV